MIRYILIIVTVVFAVSGLAEFFHFLRLLICIPKRRTKSFHLIFLKKGSAVNQLDFAVSQQRWLGDLFADKIIAVYSDLSCEELKKCDLVAEGGNAIICKNNNFENFIC